jgi:hypothetical protein
MAIEELRVIMSKRLISRFNKLRKERGIKSALNESFIVLNKRFFNLWEKMGFYIIPVHFYEPIPCSQDLLLNSKKIWQSSELFGIDMNDKVQLEFLCQVFPQYTSEYESLNSELTKGDLGAVDKAALYTMVRHFRPSKIIEIGSGASTYIFTKAIIANKQDNLSPEYIVVDPYPSKTVKKIVQENNFTLIQDKCENLDLGFFSQLKSGDLLFIDSTHVVKTGGEVNFLLLDVLPRLPKGVIVHFHDIFLPFEYPEIWVLKEHKFWTEQYLLQAFLICNNSFEVLLGCSYAHSKYSEKLELAIPDYDPKSMPSGSFWLRRVT